MDWLALAIGAGGLGVGIVGLIFALIAGRAAKSEKQAAREARDSIGQTISLANAQRALGLVDRLTFLHREQRWDAAGEVYRELHTLLGDIDRMLPQQLNQLRAQMNRGIGQLSVIQSQAYSALSSGDPSPDPSETLNFIRTNLEALVSGLMPAGHEEGE